MYQRPSGQGPTPIKPRRAIAGLERAAASLLNSPNLRHQKTGAMALPVQWTQDSLENAIGPLQGHGSREPSKFASSKSDQDSSALIRHLARALNSYRVENPTFKPEISRSRALKMSSTSQDRLLDGLTSSNYLLVIENLSPCLQSAEHHLNPLCQCQAVSPKLSAGLSTGSMDRYLNTVSIENRSPIKRIILDTYIRQQLFLTEPKHGCSFFTGYQESRCNFRSQSPEAMSGPRGRTQEIEVSPSGGSEFHAIIRPVIKERRPSLPSPVITSHPGILKRRPSAPLILDHGAPMGPPLAPSNNRTQSAILHENLSRLDVPRSTIHHK
jgi:hypothetical protein